MKASFTAVCALCNVCTRKRPNQEFWPNPNLRFFCRTEPAKTSRTPNRNFGRFLIHTRKRPNQEFLSNSNRTEPPIFFAEPNRNFGRFLVCMLLKYIYIIHYTCKRDPGILTRLAFLRDF